VKRTLRCLDQLLLRYVPVKEVEVTDRDVMAHINELVYEEHELHARAEQRALTEEERERLQGLNVSLDQC
jgi:hypothetical protein